MYKLSIETLTNLKKQLEASNKALISLSETAHARGKVLAAKQIKANEKQIKLLTEKN